ncbi:FYVE, RhoGEF and PH domain-containing protein 4-like [Polistes fuscatus]|uniref:FYVE, RhoGEF and PH domain-containing protein 4-like n=1 Tax=Polistes fuscatus TaxID=30207 RepID=UPI001CA92E2B|nr:FYVE, RhoGEF and PH domain-containing protein 4-like [Polistes fuscatus]XP_043490638.1 FYVE, RhoGEF and PH domain-containing protein 4-like [Polistes fuscatus]XP_043491471.1 FYVE, RhoGEF and PH domain-containing protein 4-like [Polistes fuscatus]XP_043492180.1 FYVE, RhoGEF and PH domain-containing protein 4-like [Polistes fuscatus]XP_043492964.1 FYVE, RhoGEF and PH domain-containing protein 4-like [Polistes fuscatus]
MQRGQLRDISSWMTRLFPEPSERIDAFKMFGSKSSCPTSTFYTDLEITESKEVVTEEYEEKQCSKSSRSLKQQSRTNEDGSSQDSDTHTTSTEDHQYSRHSFHRIASFGGFPRFQPFVMSASSPAACIDISSNEETSNESSYVTMSHSVLEYRSSRYAASERNSHQYTLDAYAISESESEEESEETRSSETESIITVDHTNESTTSEPKLRVQRSSPDSKRKKARRVAEELLATEKKYVNILHLIDQVFQFRVDQENRAHPMFPPETVQHMFSNIKSIYKFHNDFLLPQLEERMQCWDSKPRIGDIMKNFAPFLKMYTEYVKNFDYAMNLINTLQNKVARFAAIINDIQKLDECAKLSLSHHMLSPIQRLPRYELLLKDYLKNLTEENSDYEDTKKALELVSTAANHTNEAMKKIDKFKKLLEIQESIYDATDLVSATRELIKEGRIVKISARSGDHQDRHLFLFSDLLLLCSLRLIPGPPYRLRAKFLVEDLQVVEGDNLETANTFYIRYENKNVELYTYSAAEKASWLDALFQTMQEIMRRKASLKTGNAKTSLVKADDVNRCMVCEVSFSVMKRKHNCRACGIVVCSKCSNQKLLFEDNKNMRVCRLCHAALTQPLSKSPSSPSGPVPSLLQVSASAPSVLSGYLLLKTQASKPWTRRWFALHIDFVLYSFKSETESMAMTATPMPGFMVTDGGMLTDEDPLSSKDRIRAFKMHHSRKCYYLQASSDDDKEKWMHALQLATKAELPHLTEQIENEHAQECQSSLNDIQ